MMSIVKVTSVLCVIVAAGAWTLGVAARKSEFAYNSAPATQSKKSLAEIDLSKIGRIAPKGRMQDKHYNPKLEVVDDLIANGKESIPYLISKIDDQTLIDHHVKDYWSQINVGDVALLILSSFSNDASWEKQTIPGTSWEELFEAKQGADISFLEYYSVELDNIGRGRVKAKWAKIWAAYKDRIVWDDAERCFKLT